MRMVSNKHVTSTSMKRFKKVHVQHKEYVAKPVVERVEVKFEEKEGTPEVRPEEKEYISQDVIESGTTEIEEMVDEELAAPKPKRSRKKKTEETVENNEEKPEDNG